MKSITPPQLRLAGLAALALIASSAARAEFVTGEMLRGFMNSPAQTARDQALGYVVGVHDASRGAAHCAPDSIGVAELIEKTKAMLEQVGSMRAMSADLLIAGMLKAEFPCPEEKAPAAEPAAPVKRGGREAGVSKLRSFAT